ncbi:MAG: indole-3-glycerol phosphate synthase TrpC [Bacteroidales bacterium]
MMNILNKIVEKRRDSLQKTIDTIPLCEIKARAFAMNRAVNSLKDRLLLRDTAGIISEFKRASPSRGDINIYADVKTVTKGYVNAGASALSVLTEPEFFKGDIKDLTLAREENPSIPILRKDFIVDPYQVYETKAMGADVMLLIAACLDKNALKNLNSIAKSLSMEVIFEIHEESELDKLPDSDVIVGVNNRNLKTMEVDIEKSMTIASALNKHFVLIAESGLTGADEIRTLKKVGYKGFLMGESFMKAKEPHKELEKLIQGLVN